MSKFLIRIIFSLIIVLTVSFLTPVFEVAIAADQAGYRYYYKQLEDFQKEIYEFVLSAPHDTASYVLTINADLSIYSSEEISKFVSDAVKACRYDNPEKTSWIHHAVMRNYDQELHQIEMYIELSEFYDEDDANKVNRILDLIAAKANPAWNNYTKAYYIASTITSCMDYDMNYVFYSDESKPNVDKQHITSIINGMAVCEGYTEIFKAIADRLDLPCVEVYSKTHAFVHVQMEDGKWYGHDPQNNISLLGDSMYQGEESEGGWINIYDLNENEFYYLSQPNRTENDYNAPSIVPIIDTVDIASVREELNEGVPQFIYQVNEDGVTCTILKYKGKQQGDLIIPDSIDGYPVTVIGNSAFAFCKWFCGNLHIPDSVTLIGSNAFAFCSGLTGDIILPQSLQTIGETAFTNCTGFNGHIQFNDSLQHISNAAFSNCTGLVGDLLLPDSLARVDSYAFQSCKGLNGKVHIPSSMYPWNPAIIEECENLTTYDISEDNSQYAVLDGILYNREMTTVIQCINGYQGEVTIPEGVTRIGEKAFYGCRKISSFSLPSSIRWIDDWAFGHTTGRIRSDISLPSGIERIGYCAFYNSNLADTVYYPPINDVGNSAFGFNPYIRRVYIPQGVISIPDNCFEVGQIRDVYIPESVMNIGDNAFGFSYDMIIHGIPGSYAEEYAAQNENMRFKFVSSEQIIWQDSVEYYLAVGGINYPESTQLTAKMVDTNENIEFVSWSTSDSNIAEVIDGTVTAKAGGRVTIEALTNDNLSASWIIYCMKYPEGIMAGSEKQILHIGETTTAYCSWIPADTALFDDASSAYSSITYTSSDPSIVVVDGIRITGKKTGTVTITATNDAGMSASFIVSVELIPPGMSALRLPTMLSTIEESAFENLECEIVIIPDNCSSIGEYAFRNCKNLKYIRVPMNTQIAPNAFDGCNNTVLDIVAE